MTEHEPNDEQERLIHALDGIYKVDAGAGTGKTFTITRRYAHILETTDAEPDDILLTTFTENGAEAMTEGIIERCDYDLAALRDAPIATFHGYCHQLLQDHGFRAPELLGIDDRLPTSTQIIEDAFIEQQQFQQFLTAFMDRHPEYDGFFVAVHDPSNLLGLIRSLASKGIIPEQDGWYRETGSHLDGDRQAFLEAFNEANAPQDGVQGPKDSELKSRLSRYDTKLYPSGAPTKAEIRSGDNSVPDHFGAEAFDADRDELKAFVHDLYVEYLEYALANNYINFQFLLVLAYVLLVEDDALRSELSFEYVMLDEFQDTNEIQLKLALLLSGTGNIAAVGDWKQSIFSFQYASVENILEFEDRLQQYVAELNSDRERISYAVDSGAIKEIELVTNYRSGQQILDLAAESLTLPATAGEEVGDEDLDGRVHGLEADEDDIATSITAVTGADEIDAVLDRIMTVLDSEEHMLEDGTPEPGDIAVLVRKRSIGMEIQERAREHDIPVAFEGGIELFRTDPAKLVLAWLRILGWGDSDRGWAVVLDAAGYSMTEIETIMADAAYPDGLTAFRDELAGHDRISGIARSIFERYGHDSAITTAIITVLQQVYADSTMDLGGLARFIESAIEEGQTYDVDTGVGEDAVTVRTIHKAKGLEYPVVIIAGMDQGTFPSTSTDTGTIRFREPIGLRQTKEFHDGELPYVYDRWQHQILSKTLAGGYDEERRLLYVAMTRAQQHLILTAEAGNESRFFTGLVEAGGIEPDQIDPVLRPLSGQAPDRPYLETAPVTDHAPRKQGVHSIMAEPDDLEAGRGVEFGKAVHTFAEDYIEDPTTEPGEAADYEHLMAFLDGLDGRLRTEETVLFPLDVGGRRVTLEGVIDLLQVTDDRVAVIDYKTDLTREREPEYRKQLSVYHHALQELFPDREITTSILYTRDGRRQPIEPLDREELAAAIR